MTEEPVSLGDRIPSFLPYHRKLADLLARHEDGIWDWFASDQLTEHAFDEHRLYLLKSSVRLDQDSYGDLYAQAREVASQLDITAPITLYQGTGAQRNAALIYMPREVNLVFEGDILSILNPAEMRCLFGHEMAHFLHQTREDGRYFTADRMLQWICGEGGAHQAHARSLWLSRLYQEIFADRVGLAVCGDRDAAISTLIKASTGLTKFSVPAYLEQARETLGLNAKRGAGGGSHPESYIRAIALDDWASDPTTADERLAGLVEGAWVLERLDLLAQKDIAALTPVLILAFLDSDWGDSETLGAHLQTFDPRLERISPAPTDGLERIAELDTSLKSYFAYVLADFATADPELEDVPLFAALDFSHQWGFAAEFDALAVNDLKLTKKKLAELRAERTGAQA